MIEFELNPVSVEIRVDRIAEIDGIIRSHRASSVACAGNWFMNEKSSSESSANVIRTSCGNSRFRGSGKIRAHGFGAGKTSGELMVTWPVLRILGRTSELTQR